MLLLFAVHLPVFAGTITGQIQTATGGTINNGTLTFTLSQPVARRPCPLGQREEGEVKKLKPKQMYDPKDQANLQAQDYSKMDAGIRDAVKILIEHVIETFQSCQGGTGRSLPWATGSVQFVSSNCSVGFRYGLLIAHPSPVSATNC